MSTSATSQLTTPSPTSVLFARGVIARLGIWPALRIAVDQGWGGPESAEKCTWMASIIVDAFEEQNPAPDAIYIEEQLLQIMEDEFETVLEDGSVEVVAKDIERVWQDVQSGSHEAVRRFEEQAEKLKGKKVQVEEATGDGSDWEDESDDGMDNEGEDEDEAPQLIATELTNARPTRPAPEADEDGFTLVKGKGKSHR